MDCDLFQGIHHPPLIFIEIWSHLSLSHAAQNPILPHLCSRWKWKPSRRAPAHTQGSSASKWAVFLTMRILRDGFCLSHLVHPSAFFTYPSYTFWGFTLSKAEWRPKDVNSILRVFITKLGWSYPMKVLCGLKEKRDRGKEVRGR